MRIVPSAKPCAMQPSDFFGDDDALYEEEQPAPPADAFREEEELLKESTELIEAVEAPSERTEADISA